MAVYRNGIRSTEFFKDYDRLRCGRITERQFLSALTLAVGRQAQIGGDDGERVVGFYRCPDGSVDYREFCEMLENAFNVPQLDKKPTQDVARPPTGALGRVLPILTEEEERRADEVLATIRNQVMMDRTIDRVVANQFTPPDASQLGRRVASGGVSHTYRRG